MFDRRSLIPRTGNAARPVFFLLLVMFSLMLVGFPILIDAVGLGIGTIVLTTLIILPVALGTLWFTAVLGQKLDRDEHRLDAGEIWAEWTISERERRAFVSDEHQSTIRRAMMFAAIGTVAGLGYWYFAEDALTAWVLAVAFCLAACITLLTGPPHSASSDAARHVQFGPNGVRSLGRYQAFKTTGLRLRRVDIEDGDPPVMRFSVKSGRRSAYTDIRVPIAAGKLDLATSLAQRLRHEHNV